jgi:EAL domain-containing protein (putative c-di-GMP-specific phosphodiesterase class I)
MLIAEGVEEDDMLHYLKSFGYNFVQGFMFHKPEKFI